MADDYKNLIREHYSRRAAFYDVSSGGWHAELAQDFVRWLNPQSGETVLDLACGTGLVTILLAAEIGMSGRVIGVDLTPEMVEIGKEREKVLHGSGEFSQPAKIDWLVADITSEALLDAPSIKEVLDGSGGFDIISLCSALVLLPDQLGAVKFWVDKLLKPGGRMIIDVPTEDLTIQFLMTHHLPVALSLPNDLSRGRLWIKGHEGEGSLKHLFESVSLKVEQNIRTRSYLKETWYDADEATARYVLKHEVKDKYPYIEKKGKLADAQKVWSELWRTATSERRDGGEGVLDAHPLYVCIGRKS